MEAVDSYKGKKSQFLHGPGIYAYKTSVGVIEWFEDMGVNLLKYYVFGTVRLWGEITQHRDGYRAQFAYPNEIMHWDGVEVADYGVPQRALTTKQLEELCLILEKKSEVIESSPTLSPSPRELSYLNLLDPI